MSPDLSDARLTEIKQQAIDWLVRLRADDISDDEIRAFADWLAQDYQHSEAFAYAEELFDDMVLAASSLSVPHRKPIDTHQALNGSGSLIQLSHNSVATQSRRRAVRAKYWMPAMLAMAAVWLFSVILVMPESSHPFDGLLSDYHTVTGEFRDINLADGSHMLLNTNSAVSINYDGTKRQVVLHHGQARFTVAKDSQRPFEVKVDDLNITALGTVFEVYRPDAAEISVIVQQHAVRVDILDNEPAKGTSNGVNLQAGQRLQYRHDGSLAAEPIEVDQATAWQQRRLFVNDRPLAELISELNRYRLGRIFLADRQLSELRVTGVFSLDNPDDILRSVCNVLNLQETRLSAWWVLLRR